MHIMHIMHIMHSATLTETYPKTLRYSVRNNADSLPSFPLGYPFRSHTHTPAPSPHTHTLSVPTLLPCPTSHPFPYHLQ